MEYLKRRWAERSTKIQIGMVAVLVAQIAFPKYADIINEVAIALGLTGIAIPDNKPKV